MKKLYFFFFIFFLTINNFYQNTNCFCCFCCFCDEKKCPIIGYNYLYNEKSNITITYFYIKQNNGKIVVSNASTIISYESLDNGSSTNKCVEEYSKSLNDLNNTKVDAGHILAKRLGGLGTEPLNIFPQNYTINRGIYAQYENEIYQLIYKNTLKSIKLEWKFYYKTKKNTRPYKIKYSYNNLYYNKSKIFTN